MKKLMTTATICLLILFAACTEKSEPEKFVNTERETIERPAYKDVRIKKFNLAVQAWTFRRFSFFETLEKVKELGIMYLEAYPGQKLSPDIPGVAFSHNLSDENVELVKKKLKESGIKLISYGVVGFKNTEESMSRVFNFAREMGIKTIVTEPQFDDYSLLEKMVKKHNIKIAIHNHPQPSKYARPETVLEHVRGLDERIGACADTGHWMRGGIKPVDALKMLEGRIIDVHLKDRSDFGTEGAVDVPFGEGKANIHDILAELTLQDFNGYLCIEHENKADALNPLPAIRKGLEYIKSITYYEGYQQILGQYDGRYHKHGWNHYGPGYFLLDEKTGVLKSQGGMGLFWYSVKKFRDFILELDFKCSRKDTNSGIFLRVPEVPANNSYIYHSFEIQINDEGKGIHKTASVYDAEPPMADASRETGKWNHFKITFKGNHIRVELNNILVIDWEAEPRGKVKSFAREGYIGLQNHDSRSPVYFKNIYIKEL
ncbi:MAG: family 16 glycoside hydrolase [Candidatus Aminicenantales bacterium]